jgi:hypothetical protein
MAYKGIDSNQENFKAVSRLADHHTTNGDRNHHSYHPIAYSLHDAAQKIGIQSGMSSDHPLIQHHLNSVVFHKKMSEGGYDGKPTEGPHAPGKGGLLGVPVSYSSGK